MTSASNTRPFFPNELLAFVARSGGITHVDLVGKDKSRKVVRARAVAAIVMRERGISYLRMAKYFNRDHSTLVHAVNTFGTRYANDPKAHEMLDYARFEFLKDKEPANPRKQYRRYGFATMEVGEVRSFEVKTAMEDRSVRRAAHKLNEFGDVHYITWLDREALADGTRVVNVKRLR